MTIKVSDLSLDEFRSLLKDVVTQTLREMLSDSADEGLELNDETARKLSESLALYQAGGETISADDVAARLGLK